MDLTNEWYFYEQALDKTTCNKIVKLASKDFEKGTVIEESGFRLTSKRISDVFWTQEQWLYDLVWPYMEAANETAGWKYDITAAEAMQITRYKKGGFYNFHKDGRSDTLGAYDKPENKFMHGNIRKLSMSIILNNNYEGGQLQFVSLNQDGKVKIYTPKNQNTGYIIVFPSFMGHRVKSVTRGVRYSLVCWFLGLPFK